MTNFSFNFQCETQYFLDSLLHVYSFDEYETNIPAFLCSLQVTRQMVSHIANLEVWIDSKFLIASQKTMTWGSVVRAPSTD